MPGPAVTIGTAVILTPGAAGPPDSGVITTIFPPFVLNSGMPLATIGSLCTMINSVTGVPYPLPIGMPASMQVYPAPGRMLVRMGDFIPTPPGILSIVGPPAMPLVMDNSPM